MLLGKGVVCRVVAGATQALEQPGSVPLIGIQSELYVGGVRRIKDFSIF